MDPGDNEGSKASSVEVTVNGGTFRDNIILGGNGGVIYLESGTLTVNGGEFLDNELQSGNGGGIYMTGGTFNMYGGTFEGNSAGETGGAVYIANGTFNMTGGEFIGNSAAEYPGFYVNGDINLGGDVRIEGNTTSAGVEQNVYLATEDAKVNIVSPIAEAYIGITKLNNSGVVAVGSGYTLQDYDALALYCDGSADYAFTVNKDLNQIEMGERSAHEHVYSDYRVDATCDEQGYLMRVCPGCHHIATETEVKTSGNAAYLDPASETYKNYLDQAGNFGIMVGGERIALAVIAPMGHNYQWVNDDTDEHATYGGYFVCENSWKDVVTQEDTACARRMYLKVEGLEEGGYNYTGEAQAPAVYLSLYSLDEEGNEVFFRNVTSSMFTAAYAENTAAGEARITLSFNDAAQFSHNYQLTVPTGESMGDPLGSIGVEDGFATSDAQPVVTFTINPIPAEVTMEQSAIPQDGREENAWYTDEADYEYFFEHLEKTATANKGLFGEVAGKWEWNVGTAPSWSETPPRLVAGDNVLAWKFTPTDASITAAEGELVIAGVVQYTPSALQATPVVMGAVVDTEGFEGLKAKWSFTVLYNKGTAVTLTEDDAIGVTLLGEDGTEYETLVVGTYRVRFSYTENGETVTVIPPQSVTITANTIHALKVTLSEAPVYDTAALEDLRGHLTVKGEYTVGTETELTSYTLTCISVGGWKNMPGKYTVRVTYGQMSEDVEVTVLPNRVERLEAAFEQTSPVYTSTEKTEIGGYGTLTVTAVYSDGSEKALGYDASGMNGYTIAAGTFADGDTVTIYYKETDKAGSVANVSAEVHAVVDGVRATHITYEVKEGEHIFTSDTVPSAIQGKLTVTLHYNDGTSEPVEDFTVETVLFSSDGTVTFVVEVTTEQEGTFRTEGTVTPEEVAPESLEISLKTPAGTIYVTEDAESVKEFLTVTVVYNDGTDKALTAAEYAVEISGGELQPGANTLIVSYAGGGASLSRNFVITAAAVVFDHIVVEVKEGFGSGSSDTNNAALNDGLVFTSTTESDLKAFITVTGIWNDDSETEIPVYSYTVSGSFIAGVQTFTVSYTDDSDTARATHTATFTAKVEAVVLTGISVVFRQGGNTIYANTQPDALRSMLTVVATYNDGTEKIVSTGYSVQVNGGAGFTEEGENKIAISYTDGEVTKEAEASGSIVVTKKALAGVRAESVQGSGVLYASADWAKVASYLAVYAVYNDGSEARLAYDESGTSGYTLTGNLRESSTVTVLYQQYNAQATLRVIPVVVVRIDEITVADGATFYTNTSLETVKNYLTVEVTFNDGQQGTLTPSEYELTGEMTAGEATLTLTTNAGNISGQVRVSVTANAITGIASVAVDTVALGEKTLYSDVTAEELQAYVTVTVNLNNGETQQLKNADFTLSFMEGAAGGAMGEKYLIRVDGTGILYEWTHTFEIVLIVPTRLEVTFEQGDLAIYVDTPWSEIARRLTVKATYNNGTVEEIAYDGTGDAGYTLSGNRPYAGQQNAQLTVHYTYNETEVTGTFTANVTAVEKDHITAELSEEVPVIYDSDAPNAESADADLKALVGEYLTVRLVYNNGSTQDILAANYTLAMDGEWKAGEVTIKVTYDGLEETFLIDVLQVEATGLSATVQEGATIYTSDTLDGVKEKLTVTAYYNDGTQQTLEASAYTLRVSVGSLALGGAVTFTVEHTADGAYVSTQTNAQVTISVPVSIAATYSGATLYPTSSAEAVKAAITVTATYNDGRSGVSVTNFALGVYDLSAAQDGKVTIPVTYTERGERVATSVEVTVTAVTLASITAEWKGGAQPTVYTSWNLDALKAYLTVKATGSDDSDLGEVEDYALAVQSGTWGQAGAVTIRVSYQEKTFDLEDVVLTAYALASHGVVLDQDFIIYKGYTFEEVKAQIEAKLSVVLTWTDGANHYAEHETAIVSVEGTDGGETVTVTYTVDGDQETAAVTLTLTEDAIVSFRVEMNEGYTLYTSGNPNDVLGSSTLIAVHKSGNETEAEWSDYVPMLTASGWSSGGEVLVTVRVFNATGDALLGTAQVTVTVTQVRLASFTVTGVAQDTLWTTDTAEELFAKLRLFIENAKNNDGSIAAAPSLTAANLTLGELSGTTRTVNVTYNNGYESVETSFTVTVEEPYVTELAVTSRSGGEVTVIAGSEPDAIKQYFIVTATYSDGETRALEAEEYTISGDISEAGADKELTFSCTLGGGGAAVSDTFTVTAEEAVLESISATFTQGEAVFYLHEFAKDLAESGLVGLVARFNNGQEIAVTLTEEMITLPEGGLQEGQNNTVTITYTYGDVSETATIEVYVTAKALESITAAWSGEGVTVYTSTKIEDLKTHITVTLVYNDGTTGTAETFEITTLRLTAGTNRIDVSYTPEEGEAKTASFELEVTAVKVGSISAVLNENVTVYDTTDLSKNITVTATNNDGTDAGTLAGTAYRVEGTLTAGQACTVKIVYNADEGIFCELKVQVAQTLVTQISASYNDGVGGLVYTSTSFEEWAKGNGFTVTATYNNGTSRSLSADEYTLAFTSGSAFTEGETSVTATYAGSDFEGETAPVVQFDVTVHAVEVSFAEVTFNGVKVTSGDSLETLQESLTAALSAQVTFNDGRSYEYTITAKYSGWKVEGGKWTATARWTVTGEGFEAYTGESALEIGGDVTYIITYEGVSESELASLTQEYTVLDADISLDTLSRDGYTFGGWSGTGVSGSTFDTAAAADVTITASWTLVAPEISGLENVTETYTPDGITLTANVTEAEGLTYTYQWYKGEEQLSGQTGKSLTLKGVAASGSYTLKVTVSGDDADAVTAEKRVQVTINKATPVYTTPENLTATYGDTLASVKLPVGWAWTNEEVSVGNAGKQTFEATFTPADTANYTTVTRQLTVDVQKAVVTVPAAAEGLVYNGEEQVGVAEGDLYTVSGGKATNAGDHEATLTLTDAANYTWSDPEFTGKLSWSIAKAVVQVPEVADKTYTGEQHASGLTATERYSVEADEGGTAKGRYSVTLKLKDASNYKWSEGEGDTVTIYYNIVAAANVWEAEVSIEGWTYGESANAPVFRAKYGSDRAVIAYKPAGAEDSAYTAEVPTNAGSYVVRVTIAETEEYTALAGTAEFTIAKEKYDMSGIAFTDASVEYSGKAQALEVSGELPAGVTVTYVYMKDGEVVESAVEAGEYTVTAVFTGDANHEAIPSMTAKLTIAATASAVTGGEIAGMVIGGVGCVGLAIILCVLIRKTRRLGR